MSTSIRGQGNPNTFGCVHAAGDGKLSNHNVITRFSVESKREIISKLIPIIRERANEEIKEWGIRGIILIHNDAGSIPNFQVTDKILACDILIDIILILNETTDVDVIDTAINLICEQMYDMLFTNGTCPSGRANRLYSVLLYLRHYITNLTNIN